MVYPDRCSQRFLEVWRLVTGGSAGSGLTTVPATWMTIQRTPYVLFRRLYGVFRSLMYFVRSTPLRRALHVKILQWLIQVVWTDRRDLWTIGISRSWLLPGPVCQSASLSVSPFAPGFYYFSVIVVLSSVQRSDDSMASSKTAFYYSVVR